MLSTTSLFVFFLTLIGSASVLARPQTWLTWRARDGSMCPRLGCDLACPYGLQMDSNHCPSCICLEMGERDEGDIGVPTQQTTTTADPTPARRLQATAVDEAECPACRSLCMMGYEKDPETGCDRCDQCRVLRRRPTGFGPRPTFGARPDEGGDPGFGQENGLEGGPRPAVVVPGLGGTDGARDCKIACIAMWEPVCGSDGRTYSNMCVKITEECRRNVKIGIRKFGVC